MAVCRQALGQGLKQEAASGANDGTGHYPPDQNWRKVIQGRQPGLHDHGLDESQHADREQSNGCQGKGGYTMFFHSRAQPVDHRSLVSCAGIEGEVQGEDRRCHNKENLARFRAESVFKG